MTKFIKSLLALGLLLSIPHFSLKSEDHMIQTINFESYLKPQDLELINQDEAMVYMSPDCIAVLKNLSSESQELKDLVKHVNAGYSVAPLKDVSTAIDQAMESSNAKSGAYTILQNYQQAILNGDALIQNKITRGGKCQRFCSLFVQNTATVGCLEVKNDALVSGNLIFNVGGAEALNAQGAFEARMKAIRGTIALSSSSITLDPSAGPGDVLPVGGGLPTPTIVAGQGFSIGPVSAAAFSSGIGGSVVGSQEFYYAIDIRIPITFTKLYTGLPTILLGLQNINPSVNAGTAIVGPNNATIAQVIVSNVSTAGAIINLVFNVDAEGVDYATSAANAAAAVNEYISGQFNSLLITLLVDGPTS